MTTFGTKMVYRKYSKKCAVKVYNFTFYQRLQVWTSRIEVDIKFPMKARVSMKKMTIIMYAKIGGSSGWKCLR